MRGQGNGYYEHTRDELLDLIEGRRSCLTSGAVAVLYESRSWACACFAKAGSVVSNDTARQRISGLTESDLAQFFASQIHVVARKDT